MDKYGRDEIFYLIADGCVSEAINRIEVIDDVNVSDKEGYSYLHIAVQTGIIEIVRLLLSKGADIECVDEFGKTPLCIAISCYDWEKNDREMIDYLLEKGANIDHIVNSGISCREFAKMKGLEL